MDVWGLPCFIRVKVEPEARYSQNGCICSETLSVWSFYDSIRNSLDVKVSGNTIAVGEQLTILSRKAHCVP